MQTSRELTLVLAEDGVLLREGLASLLSRHGFTVLATASDAEGLLTAAERHRPDVLITDVRMPPGFSDEGLRAALQVRARRPGAPVLALSQYVQRTYVGELLDSDDGTGVGYLLKDRIGRLTEFFEAIRQVADGGTILDPEVVRQLLRHRRDPLRNLTLREREVLALMAEGKSNTAIGQALTIGQAAVNKHIGNIMSKLNLHPDEGHRRVLAVLTYLREG
ncbi:response regulator transcription factor [Actinomadura sp. 6K520]|jgi:DNA-binding NarL/FixJ family response regulator|uniref:response regulator transcription factor n=1 Tax=Actinomadura sp. 6K520 TaxID=2530364 RepID=UPI001050C844|nr:response regulator transcription factor [Actinomadura sp. 6K520]TDE33270.1 response regulator transcription factor [Actinomadura sp. 6K520]